MVLKYKTLPILSSVFAIFAWASNCFAGQVNVAVASNALAAVNVLGAAFEKNTGHHVVISSGSTGKLYAQIVNGAPFDVFLAANEAEPKRLEQDNLVVPHSRFTYALGTLVAWSPNESFFNGTNFNGKKFNGTGLQIEDIKDALSAESVTRIAIANPKIAPYGTAAQQALTKLNIWETLQSKIIRGENVSQTYQFAMTNNAQVAFIAKSQIQSDSGVKGSYWEVPQVLYEPVRQQAVWLAKSRQNNAAGEFLEYLKSESARQILTNRFGYGVESGGKNS